MLRVQGNHGDLANAVAEQRSDRVLYAGRAVAHGERGGKSRALFNLVAAPLRVVKKGRAGFRPRRVPDLGVGMGGLVGAERKNEPGDDQPAQRPGNVQDVSVHEKLAQKAAHVAHLAG